MQTLCQNCGYVYERDKRLPPWNENLFGDSQAQQFRAPIPRA